MDIGSRGERGILRQHLGHVVVGPVDIAVLLERGGDGQRRGRTSRSGRWGREGTYAGENAVKPIQDVLLDDHGGLGQAGDDGLEQCPAAGDVVSSRWRRCGVDNPCQCSLGGDDEAGMRVMRAALGGPDPTGISAVFRLSAGTAGSSAALQALLRHRDFVSANAWRFPILFFQHMEADRDHDL